MRHRPIKIFLFSLTLLLQILVPAAAAKMVGHAPDALLSVICGSNGAGANHSAPDRLPGHHAHCPICHNIGGAAALVPSASLSFAAVDYHGGHAASWTASPEAAALAGEDQHRPPRGPPALA